MAQDPHKLDALQIVGDAPSGTRLLEAAADGSLRVTDARMPAGINLHLIPGLQQVDRVYLVGTGGLGVSKDAAGNALTSIQAALDEISAGHTSANPAVVLVAPGLYTENVTVEKDGIEIVGLGRVILRNSGDYPTLTVTSGVGTPLGFKLRNVRVENTQNNRACVLVDGGIGSTIGSEVIEISDCELVSTGLAGFNLDVSTVNNVRLTNVNCAGSDPTALIRVEQTTSMEMRGVTHASRLLLDYDTGGDLPSGFGSSNVVDDCDFGEDCAITLVGAGGFDSSDSRYGDVSVFGNGTLVFRNAKMGDLTVNDTAFVDRIDGSRGVLSGSVGCAVAERQVRGEAVFSGVSSVVVTFDAPAPDTEYTVVLDSDHVISVIDDIPRATTLTENGFTILFGASRTTTVRWAVFRDF